MTGTAAESDMSVGLGLLFTMVGVVAAVVVAAAGYLDATGGHGGDAFFQHLGGVGLAAALLLGSIGIVAMHAFAE